MTHWLVQSNLINSKHQCKIAQCLLDNNISFSEVFVIPFSNEVHVLTQIEDEVIIPYGSTSLLRAAIDKDYKGLFFNEDKFKPSTWMQNHHAMLNNKSNTVITTLADAFFVLEDEKKYFIRPNDDFKLFTGFVDSGKKIIDFLHVIPNPFEEIVIADPQEILEEYRCIVVGGKVVDISLYKAYNDRNSRHVVEEHILYQYAQALADVWLPHEICVMDIADIINGFWKIIEFNCFNASGFYDHDIEKIILAVNNFIMKKEAQINES